MEKGSDGAKDVDEKRADVEDDVIEVLDRNGKSCEN